jgi:hypothetical protein
MGEWRYISTITDLGTRWRWAVNFTFWSLYIRGKSPWYPLYRRMGGYQSGSGHCGEEKILAPARNRNPSLHPMSYPGSLIRRASTTQVRSLVLRTGLLWRALVKTWARDGPSSGLSIWGDRNLCPFPHANVNPSANLHSVYLVACPKRI